MQKELLEIEFRYHDRPIGCCPATSRSETITIDIFDTLEEAVKVGNETLKVLSEYFQVRADDRFKVKGLSVKSKVKIMKNIYQESIQAVKSGAKFKVDFKTRSFKLNGQYVIRNSQYEGNLGVELCTSLDEFLSNVEHLYTRYKHSIPSTMSECKSRKYFKALSDKDLEDEDMLFGVGRDIAQVELELYILCQIILGISWNADKMGKWFWQSNKDRDLVILKNWVTIEK